MNQRKHYKCLLSAAFLPACMLLANCASDQTPLSPGTAPGKVEAKALAPSAADWMLHGRTYDEQRHSPLQEITQENVDQLGLAWYFDFDTDRGIEATSIVIDGVMYTTSDWSKVYALDAKTGEKIWAYDPQVPKAKAAHACCDVVNRGVAVADGKVFVGALDGRLIALDASTGAVLWQTQTFDIEKPYTITGAPRVIHDSVIIGNGGAEYGVRGFVSAYRISDGSLKWRFYTVPGNPADGFENEAMREAAKTWTGEWWNVGGGGTVWDSMAYDPDQDLLYIGVGNGSPWNQLHRSPDGGDNLFLSSIVALRGQTGEYVWHYQTTPGETWDYTATQHMILADLDINGKSRKVIMQAPKNGFFYVLDRLTGEFISADNYVEVSWASAIDATTGRPLETVNARYEESPALVKPSSLGGHNWHPMAFNPDTGLVYIPALDLPAMFDSTDSLNYQPGAWNTGIDMALYALPDEQAGRNAMRALLSGRLIAWDPRSQQQVWVVEHSGIWNGGVLSTAGGLVFQGSAEGKFLAYNAATGEQLWGFPAQTAIMSGPVSYEIDGEQYVSVTAGWGGVFDLAYGEFIEAANAVKASRVLTFKLGANAALPKIKWQRKVSFDPPPQAAVNEELVQRGVVHYHTRCAVCHGVGAVSGVALPDLRGSAYLQSQAAWDAVVLQGALKDRGMPPMAELFSPADSSSLRAYVITQAWRAKNAQPAAKSEQE